MQIPKHLGVAFGVVLVLLAFALAPGGQAATTPTQAERLLVEAVNDVRAAHNLRSVRVDAALVRAAGTHTTAMLRENVFVHGSFTARIMHYGGRGPLFGENLAWGVGRRASARSIVSSWMQSSDHRANLLRPGWNRIGIGARVGCFLGHGGVIVVTADFAGS